MPKIYKTSLRSKNRFPSQSSDHWLVRYFKENPLKVVTSLATMCGLLCIFSYHFHIDYFPSFDLASLGGIIFAVAYAGVLLTFLFSTVLFFPSYFIWAADQIEGDNVKRRWAVIEKFILAFAGYLVLCIAIFCMGYWEWDGRWFFLIFIPIFFVSWGYKRLRLLKEQRSNTKKKLPTASSSEPVFDSSWGRFWMKNKRSLLFSGSVTVVCLAQFFPIYLLLLVLQRSPLAEEREVAWEAVAKGVFFSGFFIQIIGCYLVLSWTEQRWHPKHRLIALIFAVIFPIFCSALLGNPSFFFSSIAFDTKIGNFRAQEIVLSESGCNALIDQGASLCDTSFSKRGICNVHIMSRIGSETFMKISVTPKQSHLSKGRRSFQVLDIYLPSKEIVAIKLDQSRRYFNRRSVDVSLTKESSSCS